MPVDRAETIEDFYRKKLNRVPDSLRKDVGHFNVFKTKDFVGAGTQSLPYSRKDYYKIGLIIGRNRYSYADKVVEVSDAALLFANPMIPYKWEQLDDKQGGYFCVFTEGFLTHFGNIRSYPVFQPGNSPILTIGQENVNEFSESFEKMLSEIGTGYAYKYDLLRALVLELIHKGMKLNPVTAQLSSDVNANTRIASLFLELLERQFPIESPSQRVRFRSPNEFAGQLAVHVNHLNRALKSATGKTTSQVISERIVLEARSLLKHTDWNIAEIGYCLGYEDPSHFIKSFKKITHLTPRGVRKT